MKYLIFTIVVLLSNLSQADIFRSTLFSLNTIYLDREYNDNGATTQAKTTDTDLRLTRVEKNWSYGVIYSLSSNDSASASRTSYGLSLGYWSEKDFYINYNYFYSSKYSFGGGNEYTKGNGYEFDLGFLEKVTSSFYVGLMFAIKSFSYSEMNGSAPASATHKDTIPMFTFAVDLM
ncbi:MAG: hypothetical protein ACXVAX_06800 [Pseudobdellovibrio sp.]